MHLELKNSIMAFSNQRLTNRGPYPVSQWAKGNVRLEGDIRVAKIHGSVNDLNYTDGRRGLTGDALIVPPTHSNVRPKSVNALPLVSSASSISDFFDSWNSIHSISSTTWKKAPYLLPV